METYDMCANLIQEMIKVDPQNLENKIWLARCYWMQGNVVDAKEHFQQAIQSSEEFIPSYLSEYSHFLCYEKDQIDQQVIDELLLYKRDQEDSDALFKIALSLQTQKTAHKRYKNSEFILNGLMQKASELKPNSTEEKYTKAALCLMKGDIEEGMKLHCEIIKETNDYRSLYDIGFLLLKIGDIESAISCFIKSFIQNPYNVSALTQIFNILDQIKESELSLKICSSMMEKVPFHGRLYSSIMKHLLQMNLRKEAIELMKERAEKDENKMAAWQMLSELYLEDENWDDAITALQESIKTRNGVDPINYTNLSTAYFKKSDYLQCLQCIQTSLSQNSDKTIPYQNLLQLRKNGYVSMEQVQQIYNSLIENNPKLNKNALNYFKEIKKLQLEDFNYMSNLFKSKNNDSDFTHFIEKHSLPDCQKCKCC
ncbi:hypothetical protein ABPG72_013644 [Tetrahymena utriculariae]